MKKKVLITVLSLAAIAVLITAILFFSGNTVNVSRCIVSENGAVYMVLGENPVKLNYGKEHSFTTGDLLFVVHESAFAESYPEQTRASFVMKLRDGSENDVPQKAINVLTELGNALKVNMSDVPSLTVIYGGKAYEANRGSHSWTYDVGKGIGQTIHADSIHPLQSKDHITTIPFYYTAYSHIDSSIAYLRFDRIPDEASVHVWDASAWDDLSAESEPVEIKLYDGDLNDVHFSIKLRDEPAIYEVIADWYGPNQSGGTVTYSFCTFKPTIENIDLE